jgi:hypothetical protein
MVEFEAKLKSFNTKPDGTEVKLLSERVDGDLLVGLAPMLRQAHLLVRIEALVTEHSLPFAAGEIPLREEA